MLNTCLYLSSECRAELRFFHAKEIFCLGMEGSSAPAIGSRRFAAWANRGSTAQRGIHGAKQREPLNVKK